MKTCIGCKEQKPFTEFSPAAHQKSGYVSRCKSCLNKYHRDRDAKKRQITDGLFNVDREMGYLIDQTPNHIQSGMCVLKRDRIDHVNTFINNGKAGADAKHRKTA